MNWRGLFSRTRGPERRLLDTLTSIPPPGSAVLPEIVNVDRALRLAPVFAAGRLLASSVASLPLQTYRSVGDERFRLPTPSLFTQPSRVGTRHDWVWRAMTSLVYRGNAVGLVTERDALEFPRFVEWLNPDDVTVEDTRMIGPGSFTEPIWRWRGEILPTADVVHIPWFTLPGRVWGLSPISAYAATVSTSLASHRFLDGWFNAGGVPPGTFKNAAKTVNSAESEAITDRLVAKIRSGKPLVYGSDWDYMPITVSPNEAQFVETTRLGATEIAAVYGIPPEMIGGETGGSYTYSSPEQRQIEFAQFSLLPWLTKLESHFSQLLPRGQYVKFNVDALIRIDAQTRYGNYEKARNIGLMNVDEIRALEDMPALPDGQGQNYTPLRLQEKNIGLQTAREGRVLRLVEDPNETEASHG